MLKKTVAFLKSRSLFVLLLPVFFVLHGFSENFGFIDGKDIARLLLIYSGGAVLVYLVFFLFYRNRAKASLITLYSMSFFLFYGALTDFLKTYLPFVARYRILLPLFFLLLLVLFLYIRKIKRPFPGMFLFFNLLLCMYVIVDLATITIQLIHPPENKFSVYSYLDNGKYPLLANVPKPDIYFLLFDEYASSLSLSENYGFTNDLDSFLTRRGFQVQKKGYSNYNYTQVSMASILNIGYINGIRNNAILTVDDMGHCTQLIKNNEVVKFLSRQGYNIVNYSVFDLVGNPSPVRQTLLPLKTRLITDNTLFGRIYKDLGWMAMSVRWIGNRYFYKGAENNQTLLRLTKTFSAVKNTKPQFVYAHFSLPHDPFFFDKNGRQRGKEIIIAEEMKSHKPSKSYLQYLVYANTEIRKLVDTVLANTHGEAAIILMGDHGFREKIEKNLHQNYQAMNAVYLPGKDYHLFYDSMSSVNQFRVLFNTLFNQSIPLLKDSTIFLSDKK